MSSEEAPANVDTAIDGPEESPGSVPDAEQPEPEAPAAEPAEAKEEEAEGALNEEAGDAEAEAGPTEPEASDEPGEAAEPEADAAAPETVPEAEPTKPADAEEAEAEEGGAEDAGDAESEPQPEPTPVAVDGGEAGPEKAEPTPPVAAPAAEDAPESPPPKPAAEEPSEEAGKPSPGGAGDAAAQADKPRPRARGNPLLSMALRQSAASATKAVSLSGWLYRADPSAPTQAEDAPLTSTKLLEKHKEQAAGFTASTQVRRIRAGVAGPWQQLSSILTVVEHDAEREAEEAEKVARAQDDIQKGKEMRMARDAAIRERAAAAAAAREERRQYKARPGEGGAAPGPLAGRLDLGEGDRGAEPDAGRYNNGYGGRGGRDGGGRGGRGARGGRGGNEFGDEFGGRGPRDGNRRRGDWPGEPDRDYDRQVPGPGRGQGGRGGRGGSSAAPPPPQRAPAGPGPITAEEVGRLLQGQGALADPPFWRYIDDHGRVQGPFKGQEIQAWYTQGYIREDLKMCGFSVGAKDAVAPAERYRPLGELVRTYRVGSSQRNLRALFV